MLLAVVIFPSQKSVKSSLFGEKMTKGITVIIYLLRVYLLMILLQVTILMHDEQDIAKIQVKSCRKYQLKLTISFLSKKIINLKI